MTKNCTFGVMIGLFFGSILGSTGTILVFKKLGKLEEKKLLEHEEEHVEEVKKYYEDKIKEIKSNIKEDQKLEDSAEKVIESVIEQPKKTRIAYEGLDIHGGDAVDNSDFDYSKISREKYIDVQKEYEREDLKAEYEELPHQITKGTYENSQGYNKMELIYYEQNGIFTFTDDTICNSVTEEIIGADNLSLFGTDDASIDGLSGMYDLYLRSNKIMTDFHLIYNGTEDYYKVTGNSRD